MLDYALGKEKGAEIVGGTISGTTPRQLAAEFGLVRRLRPDAKRPVWHCSLSLPPGDHLNSEKWDQVASDFIKEMGFSESTPWVAVRHRDTDKDHIHLIVSRIDLAGTLWHGKWEARTAIEATQALERNHGLTLTPGLDAASGRKQLKKCEVEMSLRTGEQPPKLKLQNIIDEALSAGDLTAVQFAETLAVAGVQVRANLASTGTFNGFSYEIDGIAFKGSKLGKSYGWGGLQQRGVTYEQARDYQELARFRALGADQSDQSAVTEGRTDRPGVRDIRPDNPDSTSIDPGTGRGDQPAGDQHDAAAIADAGQQNRQPGQDLGASKQVSGISGKSTETNRPSGVENARSSRGNTAPTMVAAAGSGSGGSDSKRPAGSGWNARFKAASAKARRHTSDAAMGASNPGRARIDNGDLQQVKQTDPRAFIERTGYVVKKDGQRHFSVLNGKDEAYRLTCKPDGAWVWVDKHGQRGGDNIDLVKELSGLDRFIDCVYELNGGLRASPAPAPAPVAPKPPRIPPESGQGRLAGRMYLEERGISAPTILHAEKTGFLRYLADGLLFVGYQAGQIWNATKRAFDPDAEVQKRDLAGSDKSKPQILPGSTETIWIAEGGVDALAVHELAKLKQKPEPTVIVSGGSAVKSFF
ncbi:relaxase/mobilization nuclease domain-containing protein, partial [Vibrio cholerae]